MTTAPEFDSEIFAGREESRFWIGLVARSDGRVLLPAEFKAARQLRANSYIDVHGYLPQSARQPDGQEIDVDDVRSDHLVVLERLGEGRARAVATNRTIFRQGSPLPCELEFPDDFPELPPAVAATERSRLVSVLGVCSAFEAITRAAHLALADLGVNDSFGLIEPWLVKHFRAHGADIEVLSEPRRIDRYNSANQLVRVRPIDTVKRVTASGADFPLSPYLREAVASGSNGLGYAREADLLVLEP